MFKNEKKENEKKESKFNYTTLAICLVTVLLGVFIACFIL